ncbi:hypothetical protein [Histidinibacterium lentulum]|uniref:Uncharacterized protein n=1 Tax=Histidinibacterium lentulum TaxID=2480588 RepID=A0A3N2QYJ6_9RHOB|nr:hypothetical protein [Histidinibacterium lentulum]ROU00188.1 hypothetical protein EAT49_12845 [Histidinibacterium lentulum]
MSGIPAAVLSAGILASAFFYWVDIPVIYQVTLWDLFERNSAAVWDALRGGDLHWSLWVFVLSFPVAAVSTLLNLGGLVRPVAILAGLMPPVAMGGAVFTARDRVVELLGRVPGEAGQLRELMGVGVWIYLGAGVLLMVVAATTPQRYRG